MAKRVLLLGLVVLFCAAGSSRAAVTLWHHSKFKNYYRVYREATIVRASQYCPAEMSWQGNSLVFKFNLNTKSRIVTPRLVISLRATYVQQIPRVSVYTKQRRRGTWTISGPGVYELELSRNCFSNGANVLRLYGANIHPIGYGQSPPCVVINDVRVKTK